MSQTLNPVQRGELMRLKIRQMVVTLLFLGGPCLMSQAQSPLTQAFLDLKSNDPAKVQKAKDDMAMLVSEGMPNIERDTPAICNGLKDPDPAVRLQSTGILVTIVVAGPTHNQVVLSCMPGLIVNATDPADRVRNNALFAIAMNPAGPPTEAQAAFVSALTSKNLRTAEVGAAGLLRESRGTNEANQKLVEDALTSTSDAKQKLNLLYAISGAEVTSDSLFQTTQRFIFDSDPDVQQAAIDAVAATGTDKGKIEAVMQNLASSASSNEETKKHAGVIINNLHAAK